MTKQPIADLFYVFVAIVLALSTVAATRPDGTSAKRALEDAGMQSVRILSLVMPCRLNGGMHFYGVFFDAYVHPARRTNRACFDMRKRNWTVVGPPDGK